MGESPGVNGAAIGRLRQQIQGFMDADLILPEDGRWLLATLDRSVQRLTTADPQSSEDDMRGFIERLHSLIQTGLLGPTAGHPPVDTARVILASLHGQEEGAGSAVSLSLESHLSHCAKRRTPKKGISR